MSIRSCRRAINQPAGLWHMMTYQRNAVLSSSNPTQPRWRRTTAHPAVPGRTDAPRPKTEGIRSDHLNNVAVTDLRTLVINHAGHCLTDHISRGRSNNVHPTVTTASLWVRPDTTDTPTWSRESLAAPTGSSHPGRRNHVRRSPRSNQRPRPRATCRTETQRRGCGLELVPRSPGSLRRGSACAPRARISARRVQRDGLCACAAGACVTGKWGYYCGRDRLATGTP